MGCLNTVCVCACACVCSCVRERERERESERERERERKREREREKERERERERVENEWVRECERDERKMSDILENRFPWKKKLERLSFLYLFLFFLHLLTNQRLRLSHCLFF